jgi:rusticyanin
MNRMRVAIILTAFAFATGGLGTGVALATGGGSSSQHSVVTGSVGGSSYSYYRSMMRSLEGGSMMGGSYAWMVGSRGYTWMMGGSSAPRWMRGSALPGFMMGTRTDPGKVMGRLFANAAGPRVSRAEATRLGNEVPNGAAVNATHHRITFSGKTAHLVVLGSPSGGPEMTFRIAGLVNPTIEVQKGARVSIEVVNADSDTAHGLVISTTGSASSRMPMMTAARAFGSSALWFLGDPTSAGLHTGTLSFTAATPGIYQYLCPVPGHAQMGMVGTFVVAD